MKIANSSNAVGGFVFFRDIQMKFPTKDELEQLDSPLREYWKEAINKYWSKEYEEYKKEQQRKDPLHGIRYVAVGYKYV